MSSNPAQTIPQQGLSGTTPSYTLFDSNAVALATLFGTPAAGSSLMALNYRRLGQAGKGAMTLILGFAVTGLAILFTWHLPSSVSFPMGLALLIGTRWTARALQGAAVKEHAQRGGRLGSKGEAFGLGAGYLAVVLAVVFVANYHPSVVIGSKDEVYYSGSATRQEAQLLGNALKASGYFIDRGADVHLTKGKDGTIISFVVKAGGWDEPGMLENFEELGREVAPSVGGFPLRVRLMNKIYDVEKESMIGKVAFAGDDDIYYLGAATEAQAQALGQAFKSIGFFKGKGTDVFLSRHSDGTVLSFVVGEAGWADPALVGNFEAIVRKAAPAVGSLPVRLRLMTPSMEVKKDEMVR